MVVRRNDDGKWTASLSPGTWLAVLGVSAGIIGGWYTIKSEMAAQRRLLERIEERQIDLVQRVNKIEGRIHE